MKIFMIADNMDIGGAETHIWELSRLLCVRGHTVTVLSGGGRLAQKLARIGVRHVTLPSLNAPVSLFPALRRLAREIRDRKPHVVHAHTRRAAFLCRLLLREMEFPLVFTAHAMFRADFPLGNLSFFPPATVTVSEDIRRHLISAFGVSEERVSVIENGIDTRRFSPRPTSAHPLTVLHVSRLDDDCAHTAALLIDAASRLEAALGHAVRIRIVGGGTALPRLSQRLRGQTSVSLLGARTDVAELLRDCDVFVGVSRAALEAMATEKPVILSGNEGYLGIVDSKALSAARESNFCARGREKATAERLIRDLLRLAALSEEQRAALGKLGRETVCRYYSAEGMTDKVEAVYRAELDRFRSTRRQDALICGYYGYGNCGDELILQSIIDRQRLLSPQLRLSVMTADGRDRKDARCLRRYDVRAVAREMKKSGAFILGGGSLLQDSTSRRSLLYYLSLLALARQMAIPTMLYANGLGPLSPSSLALCRRLLTSVDVISLRDRRSYETVRAMHLPRVRVVLGADPVLGDRPSTDSNRAPILALFPRGGDKGNPAALADAVGQVAVELGLDVAVTSMNEREDGDATRYVCRRLRERWGVRVTLGSSDPRAVERLIERASLAISERLHALILAFRANTAAVGIARDPKISSFLQDVDLSPCVLFHDAVAPDTLLRAARYAMARPHTPDQLTALRARTLRDATLANRLILRK